MIFGENLRMFGGILWMITGDLPSKFLMLPIDYTCGFVLTCMQTEEIEMHASTKIIVVTGFTTELHAGRQRVHFSILQPFLLTTYGNNRRLEDIVSDK